MSESFAKGLESLAKANPTLYTQAQASARNLLKAKSERSDGSPDLSDVDLEMDPPYEDAEGGEQYERRKETPSDVESSDSGADEADPKSPRTSIRTMPPFLSIPPELGRGFRIVIPHGRGKDERPVEMDAVSVVEMLRVGIDQYIKLNDAQVLILHQKVDQVCSDYKKEEKKRLKESISARGKSFDYWDGLLDGVKREVDRARDRTIDKLINKMKSNESEMRTQLADCLRLQNSLQDMFGTSKGDLESLCRSVTAMLASQQEMTQRQATGVTPSAPPQVPQSREGTLSSSSRSEHSRGRKIAFPERDLKEYKAMVHHVNMYDGEYFLAMASRIQLPRNMLEGLLTRHGRTATRMMLVFMDRDKWTPQMAEERIQEWSERHGPIS